MAGSLSYARIADRYEQVRGGEHRAKELADALLPWLPEGVVCDVGAGTAVVTQRLAGPSRQVFACDISFEMLRQATSRVPGQAFLGEATGLPLRDGCLDAVTFVSVLHHVGALDLALSEAYRVLRIGGRVLTISGVSHPAEDDMAPIFERLHDQLRPERRGQAWSAVAAGKDAGFEIVHEGLARTTTSVSPHGLDDAMEERLFSHLWDLTDARWHQRVVPAIAELRSLPKPHTPRLRVFSHPFAVLAK